MKLGEPIQCELSSHDYNCIVSSVLFSIEFMYHVEICVCKKYLLNMVNKF